jgi:molybdenum cofactor biosynthesis enzyme MoaA
MTVHVSEALLGPGPIQQLRLDVTSRCNLRCVYCAVSHPKYRGLDMSDAIVRQSIDLALELAKYNPLEPIDLTATEKRHLVKIGRRSALL